jgi:GMP reductase
MNENHFRDIYLLPNFTTVGSRDDCDLTTAIGNKTFSMPVIPSNMKSVVNQDTCVFLAKQNVFYIMHRFDVDPLKFTVYMHDLGLYSSISVGINKDSKEQLMSMSGKNIIPEYITIDVANVYSVKGISMIKFIKFHFPDTFLIAGNCVTPEAVCELQKIGVNAIRIGISNGSVCSTYNTTGFGRPQFSAIQECAKVAKVPLISDGGIKEIGDVAKALVAGASYVMAGNLFAGYEQSAGEIIRVYGKPYKRYFGSASFENGNTRNIEGVDSLIEYRGDMLTLIREIQEGLRSSVSYAGGNNLNAFKDVNYVTGN